MSVPAGADATGAQETARESTRQAPERGPRTLRIEWHAGIEEISRLREPWIELSARVQKRTAYSDHDWTVAWYRHYGGTEFTDNGTPLVGAAWQGNELVGIAPLIWSRASFSRIPVSRASFAGYNLQAGEFLVSDDRPEVPGHFLRSLHSRGGWDVLFLTCQQKEWASTQSLQESALELGLKPKLDEDDPYATADFREGYPEYLKARTGHFRQNLKRWGKRISAAGGWSLDRLPRNPSSADVQEFTRRLLAVADLGWRARQRGVEEERRHQPFYVAALELFARRGMADLCILQIGGKDAAYCLGLVERNAYFHVLMGFDDDFRNLSPGAFMLQELFKRLADEGILTVLSHGDYSYKKHWASTFVAQKKLVVFGRGWRGRLSHLAKYELEPVLRRLGKQESQGGQETPDSTE